MLYDEEIHPIKHSLFEKVSRIVYLLAIVVICLDVLYWRP